MTLNTSYIISHSSPTNRADGKDAFSQVFLFAGLISLATIAGGDDCTEARVAEFRPSYGSAITPASYVQQSSHSTTPDPLATDFGVLAINLLERQRHLPAEVAEVIDAHFSELLD